MERDDNNLIDNEFDNLWTDDDGDLESMVVWYNDPDCRLIRDLING